MTESRDRYAHAMSLAALFTLTRRWVLPKGCVCACVCDHYSALRGKVILTHGTMRMKLEHIVLSKRSQSQRTAIVWLR